MPYRRRVLSADATLDPLPRRVLVAGTAGVGKTTTAGRIGRALGVPHTEIDSLYHGPGWVPRESFAADVEAVTRTAGWVIEWQYTATRPMLAERADTLVWIDLPIALGLWRLVRRTLRRRLRRTELWNGNVEPPLWTFLTDRGHIVRWGIRVRHQMREQVPALETSTPHLRIVRLRSQREVDRFVQRLARGRG